MLSKAYPQVNAQLIRPQFCHIKLVSSSNIYNFFLLLKEKSDKEIVLQSKAH